MIIDTKQIITVTEANQNFSRAARIADEDGVSFPKRHLQARKLL